MSETCPPKLGQLHGTSKRLSREGELLTKRSAPLVSALRSSVP